MSSLTVFCGASFGHGELAQRCAVELGRLLADSGVTLVYGGASTGLMGMLADSVIEHEGQAVGVIPESLIAHEVAHGGLTKLHTVSSMHERKAMMAELGDAFMALPGGFGTADELFEIITWAQLGFHGKPISVINTEGHYDYLIDWIDQCVSRGFVHQEFRDRILVDTDARSALRSLQQMPRTHTSLFELNFHA